MVSDIKRQHSLALSPRPSTSYPKVDTIKQTEMDERSTPEEQESFLKPKFAVETLSKEYILLQSSW